MQRIRVTTKPHRPSYEITIGHHSLDTIGEKARLWLGPNTKKVAIISNQRVFGLYGATVVKSLKPQQFKYQSLILRDGERSKTFRTVERNLLFLSKYKFERSDAVIALGGGVVGDIAGFTAAVYLRGIPFIYVPTTLLAQVDSSVGGKTGVNLPAAKNFVGSFHQPAGIVTDVATLKTLPIRELRSGLYECIKQGAVGSKQLFTQTVSKLSQITKRDLKSSEWIDLISAHCRFKASIVKDDERERINGTNSRSRKILNFGHTVGHALESMTNYRRFRHGEAVAVGMIAAAEISKRLGLLSTEDLGLLTDAIRRCGSLPQTNDLHYHTVLDLVGADKKSSGGVVKWVLLERIGKPRIVSGSEIDERVLRESLRAVLGKGARVRSYQ